MNRKNMLKIENYFEAFLILSLIILFLYIIKNFLTSLLFASILVFVCYKPYKYISKKAESDTFAAVVVVLFILFVVILPLYLLLNSLLIQSTELLTNGNILIKNFNLESCDYTICRIIDTNLLYFYELEKLILSNVVSFAYHSLLAAFGTIYTYVLNFFIFIFASFFLLKDGKYLLKFLKRIIPMKDSYKDAMFIKFRDVSSAVFIDTIFIAIIQGVLVGFGFYIFSVPSPLFWGVVASFFALIPIVGTTIIWIPAVIYLFTNNHIEATLGLFLYSSIIVGLSDNLIRPALLKKKVAVHPFIIFLSILGGLDMFGFMGIFIGPILISLLISVFQLYKLDFK